MDRGRGGGVVCISKIYIFFFFDCNMIQLDVLLLGLLCSVQLVFCVSSHTERSSLFKHSSQAVSVNTYLTLCVCVIQQV